MYIVLLLLLGGLAGCAKRQAGQRPDPRPQVDKALMACLGAIRAYHRANGVGATVLDADSDRVDLLRKPG